MIIDINKLKDITETFDVELCDDQDFDAALDNAFKMSESDYKNFLKERSLTDYGKEWSKLRSFFLKMGTDFLEVKNVKKITNFEQAHRLSSSLPIETLIEEFLLLAMKDRTKENLEISIFLTNFLSGDSIGLSYSNIIWCLKECFNQQKITPTEFLNKHPFYVTEIGRELLEDMISEYFP